MLSFFKRKISSSQSGQVALILVLIIAVGIIFYAVSLNWGRIAQYKTATTVAANISAAQMASMIASYGQYQIHTTLGGKAKKCEWSSLLEIVLAAIIIIIIVILTIVSFGGLAALWAAVPAIVVALAASVAFAIAAIAIELAVLQPGLTSLWNKIQGDAPLEDRVIEQGVQVALQAAVTDNVQVPDKFDYNLNGKYATSGYQIGNSDDELNRFGYYYTDRLRSIIKLQYPELKNFVNGLKELVYDDPFKKGNTNFCIQHPQNECCTTIPLNVPPPHCTNLPRDNFGITDTCTNKNDPRCNPCCTPWELPNPDYDPTFCDDPSNVEDPCCVETPIPAGCPNLSMVRIRPESCGAAPDLAQCRKPYYDDPNSAPAISYPYVYDPYALNYANTFISFREKLGFDDENRHFEKVQATPLGNQNGYLGLGADQFDRDFRPEDATGYFTDPNDKPKGIFPFIWKMSQWGVDLYSNNHEYLTTTQIASMPNHCRWCTTQFTGCTGVTMSTNEGPLVLPTTVSVSGLPPVAYTCNGADECCAHNFDNNLAAPASVDTRTIDKVTPVENIAARETECAHHKDGTTGMWWKEGADMYCSKDWPYYANCDKHGGATACEAAELDNDPNNDTCDRCTAATANQWPDDPVDNMIYQMPSFLKWADTMIDMPAASLKAAFTEWYEEAKMWIAPACSAGLDCTLCSDPDSGVTCTPEQTEECNICNPGNNGMLIMWKDFLAAWATKIRQWQEDPDFVGTDVWCVPPLTQVDPVANDGTYMTQQEVSAIDPTATAATWGDVGDVIQCLNYNLNNESKFLDCKNTCSHAACENLPRTLVENFNPIKEYKSNPPPPDAAYICLTSNAAQCLTNCNSTEPSFVDWKTAKALPATYTAAMCGASWASGNVYYDQYAAAYNAQYQLSVCPSTTSFMAKLGQSAQLAQVQRPKLQKRLDFLSEMNTKAQEAKTTLQEGSVRIKEFLDGPVAHLIELRKKFESNESKLSNFAIYGWESSARPSWGSKVTRPSGYWHVVRVETFAPKRCKGSSGCGANRYPWVKTKISALGFKRCYFLTETSGIVKVRVTRFDEDHDYSYPGSEAPRFANNSPIWKFLYNKPGTEDYRTGLNSFNADALGSPTYPDGSGGCYGYGYSQKQLDDELPPQGAFMINRAPRDNPNTAIDESQPELECWKRVERVLKRGVVTESCAQYFLNGNRMSVKFRKCPKGSFLPNATTTSF